MDGEKLVPLTSGLPLPQGFQPPNLPGYGEYRTEHESFTRVVVFGSVQPALWVTWTRDGLVNWYGDSTNARMTHNRFPTTEFVTFGWLLSRKADWRGNTIEYKYTSLPHGYSASRLIESITYTGAPPGSLYASAKQREIKFHYESRADETEGWVNGLRLGHGVRLKRIDMYAPAPAAVTKVRSYKLSYAESKRTRRSSLTSITECDAADVCVPETRLLY